SVFRRRRRHVIPVGGPFPDVAGHVEETEAVRWERADRRRACETVLERVAPREVAVPDVGHELTVRSCFGAPRERNAVESAACGEFPFGFGWERTAGPARVRVGILVRDVDDGMVCTRIDAAPVTLRVAPRCTGGPGPPQREVPQIDWAARAREDERARYEVF